MNDDIDQLLKNLKLRRLREIITEELARAEKKKPSYSEFIARVLREEYQHQQQRFLEYRIDRANIPERWTLETFPWKEQPGVSKTQIEQLAELGFDLVQHTEPLEERDTTTLAEAHELGTCIFGIGRTLEHPHLYELIDELSGGLLRHAEATREIRKARALEIDVG